MLELPREIELKNEARTRLNVRPLESRDIKPIFELSSSHLASNKHLDYAKFEGNLKRILAEKHSLLLVAESEKKDIVGFTLGRPLESVREDSIPQESKIDFLDHNPSKKIFFLNGSFVHKDYRNSGLTKHFLRWREAHARDLGYSHSLITTVNPAIEHIAGKEGYGLPLLQELVGGAKYFLKKL